MRQKRAFWLPAAMHSHASQLDEASDVITAQLLHDALIASDGLA
jgi:hypothetical protein